MRRALVQPGEPCKAGEAPTAAYLPPYRGMACVADLPRVPQPVIIALPAEIDMANAD
jgi:hypothetical protein